MATIVTIARPNFTISVKATHTVLVALGFPASIASDVDVLDGLSTVHFRKRGAPTTSHGGVVSYPNEVYFPVANVSSALVGVRAAEASGGKYLASDRRFRVSANRLPLLPNEQWEVIDGDGVVWSVLATELGTWNNDILVFTRA